ncbi:hypothetical protein GF406_07325 [candidate division KSB1 bacterium]|nr:hypothetical protein [candidate division KSB1 bacterium]
MSKLGLFLCILGLIPSFANARITDISPLTLDPVGELVDSTENARYHIFGTIEGLTAARFYNINSGKFQLHLLRNTNERAQILILDLPAETFWELDKKLRDRIDEGMTEIPQFDHALFPIGEAQWTERSANKKVLLSGGSQLFVTLERAEQDTLIAKTLKGLEIRLPDHHIVNVIDNPAGHAESGPFITRDPNNSRLFFAPTGRRLESGHAYLANYFIFFPTVAVGLTDYLSVSGGVSLIPGAESQLLYFAKINL